MSKYLTLKTAKDIVISKAAIKETVESIEEVVSEGYAGGVEVLHFAKYLEELAKKVRASQIIREDFIREVDDGVRDYRGADIAKSETGVKYDFFNSEAWKQQKEIVLAETEKLKEIEKQCKATTKVYTPIDHETGEALPSIAPPIKTSTTSPKITLK